MIGGSFGDNSMTYAEQSGRAALTIRSPGVGRRSCVVLLLLAVPVSAVAQAGVPGARLETGRDHRAAVRAEAYRSVARFFADWREAWNGGDAKALARLYT